MISDKEPYPGHVGGVYYTYNNGGTYDKTAVLSWDYIPVNSSRGDGWKIGDLVLYLGNCEFFWIQGNLKRFLHQECYWEKHFIPIEEYVKFQENTGTKKA